MQDFLANLLMYYNQIAMAVRGGIELYNIHPWLAASVLVVLALVVFGSLFLWLVRGRVASWTTKFIILDYRRGWLWWWPWGRNADQNPLGDVVLPAGKIQQVRDVVEARTSREFGGRLERLGATLESSERGLIIDGGPGTGKTLLVNAVAKDLRAAIVFASGGDLITKYQGSGPESVKELFRVAKANQPCIIFVDEIDSLPTRGSGYADGGHDEQRQTLLQFFVQMDLISGERIVVVGATNAYGSMDGALLRSGRLGERVTLELPDFGLRVRLLQVHTAAVPLDADVDFRRIAAATDGKSGADLRRLVSSAVVRAARRDAAAVGMADFVASLGLSSPPAAASEIVHPAAW